MTIAIEKEIRKSAPLRNGFFGLARSIFGLDFEKWYQAGDWTDRYLPYAAVVDGTVAANVSANIIDTSFRGEKRRYIQIGTVMTAPDYRGRGLSRMLLEELLSDWKDRCDSVYLYANDSVLDFYPKFGFRPAEEYQHTLPLIPQEGDFIRLDMDRADSRALLLRCYQEGNPFSELPMLDNAGLLMFYCSGPLRDSVWYSPKHDTVCIAEFSGGILECFDLFGRPGGDLPAVLSELAQNPVRQARLGFTPKFPCPCQKLSEEDTTLFVLEGKENLFRDNRLRMPALSRA